MSKLESVNYAKMPNEIAKIKRSRGLSVLEEKFMLLAIRTMQKKHEQKTKYKQLTWEDVATTKLSFNDFTKTMQITDNYQHIYDGINDLLNFSMSVKTEHITKMFTVFTQFTIDEKDRTIEFRFNDMFYQFLNGIARNYYELHVSEIVSLSSTHAIRIYQILKVYHNMSNKTAKDHANLYTIEELKENLNIKGKYKLFADFNKKVLKLAVAQINKAQGSAFDVEIEEIKNGKKVVAIQFYTFPKGSTYYQEKVTKSPTYAIDLLRKQVGALAKKTEQGSPLSKLIDKLAQQMRYKNNKASINIYVNIINDTYNKKLTPLPTK